MRIQKTIVIAFLSIVGALCAQALPVLADETAAWRITDYQVYVRPMPNTYDVTLQEDLSVTFNEESRGIIRDIPYNAQPIDWEQAPLYYESVSVTDFGNNSLPNIDYHEAEAFHVRVGDPEVYLLGPQNYRLKFDISNGMWRYFADHAEIYWNATGNAWPIYIDKAAVEVDFSGWDLDWTQVRAICYTGAYGSSEQDCVALPDEKNQKIKIQALKALWPYEGLTFAVSVPLASVPKPPAFELVPNARMQVDNFNATLKAVPESQTVTVNESFNALYRETRERLAVQLYNYWDEDLAQRNFLYLENGESNHQFSFAKPSEFGYYDAAGLIYLDHADSKDERYDFSYDIAHGAWYRKDQMATFAWELINYDWMALVNSAQVTFDLSEFNIPDDQIYSSCYLSDSTEYDPCVITKENGKINISLNRRLMPEEILMIYVSVPEKYIPANVPFLLWLKIYWPLGLLLILALLAMFAVWRWRENLRKTRAVVAQYDSVDDLPPGVTALINSHGWKNDYWTAEIIYFATRKYIQIENRAKTEEASDQYFFKLLKTDYKNDANLLQYQKDLLTLLFEDKTEFDVAAAKTWSNVKKEQMYNSFVKLKAAAHDDLVDKEYFHKSYAGGFSVFLSVLLIFFSFWFLVPWWEGFYTTPMLKYFLNPYTYLGLAIPLLIVYFRFRTFKAKGWIFGALILFLMAATAARTFLPPSFPMVLFVTLLVLFFYVLFAVPYWLIFTDKGLSGYWHNLGLIEYLETAEAERFKFGELTNLFEKLLPYAIAFGFLEKWAAIMKEIYKQPPEWLNDQRGLARSLAAMNGLSSAMKGLNRAMAAGRAAGTARRYGSGGTSYRSGGSSGGSSGFSSGGGFSGGGSGGGGGSRW